MRVPTAKLHTAKAQSDHATDLRGSRSELRTQPEPLSLAVPVTQPEPLSLAVPVRQPVLSERQLPQSSSRSHASGAQSLQQLPSSEPLFKNEHEKKMAHQPQPSQPQALKEAIIARDVDALDRLVDYADVSDEGNVYPYYPAYLLNIGPTLTAIAADGQTAALQTFLQIFARKMPDRTLPLRAALIAAAQGGHGETLRLLLGVLDPTIKSQVDQALPALRSALDADSVPATKSVIDWLKAAGLFGAAYLSSDHDLSASYSDEDSDASPLPVPLQEELHTLSDQKIRCLAKAGYVFASDFFPWHCADKTLDAIQDILFGEGLQDSPLSELNRDASGSLEQVWSCIAQCGQLNDQEQFDVQASTANLMLLGFRKPVAIWLADVLRICSPLDNKDLPFRDPLSSTQAHFFGLMLLAETPPPPLKFNSSDPLVPKQCASLARVSDHVMNLKFHDAEQFFKKCLSCITDDLGINRPKLNFIFRNQYGLPNPIIRQIHHAIEHCLNLPLSLSIGPGTTARQINEVVSTQVRRSLVSLLATVLPDTLASDGCQADVNSEVQRHGGGFKIYAETSISLVSALCRQMQRVIESGDLDTLDFAETGATPDSESDTSVDSGAADLDSDEANRSDPDSAEV